MKQVYSFRFDKKLVDLARKSGINLTEIFESTLMKLLKMQKCPHCGQRLKGK